MFTSRYGLGLYNIIQVNFSLKVLMNMSYGYRLLIEIIYSN